MTRAALAWGGATAAIIGLGAIALTGVIITTATPSSHVERYLDALARDDLVSAARLAGLQAPTAMPIGDEGEPVIRQIISSTTDRDGLVTVVAEYGSGTDAARVPFRLEPAPPLLGLVPAWRFIEPPVATLMVAADQHDRLAVNDQRVVAGAAGDAVAVRVFVPSRVTVRLDEPLLQAAPVALRVTGDLASSVVLEVAADARLERAVRQQLETLLADCATQRVLQPTGCPFGAEIDDRLLTAPEWQLVETPDIVIEPGERPGVWAVRGEGSAQLAVTIQQLFDGAVVDRDEPVGFIVRGIVVLGPEGPVLTIYPPGG